MKRFQKYSRILLANYLAFVLLIVPQLNNPELMSSMQSSKAFGFIWGMLLYVPIALMIRIINSKSIILRISIIDILLGLYSIMVIISYWLHPIDYLQMLTFGALVLFYLCVRVLNQNYFKLLLFAVVISGCAQALHGNLQLWGYLPSNHGIFKLTGSFFNPGPYAGYLAAAFPVSLAFYLFYDAVNIPIQHHLIVKLVSLVNQIKTFLIRTPIIAPFFYNNSKAGDTLEKQAEKLWYIHHSIIKIFVLISMISMCLVLPASRSRAAWLAVLVSSVYLLSVKYQILSQIKSIFHSRTKRFLLISSLITILILTGTGLYYFKKDSADGRFLIWKVATKMVAEKPVWGHGTGKFAADYMNYQAAYFKPNPNVPEGMQADNVTYAYNEFLKITVEKGIIGLLLAMAVLWSLFFLKTDFGKYKRSKLLLLATRGGLLSILVFALFSYPSEILPIQILFVLFAAIVATHQSPMRLFRMGRKETSPLPLQKDGIASQVVLYAALAVALITVYPASQYLTRQYQAYKSWKDASDIYNVGAYSESLEGFELSYPLLKTNGQFLVQYGKALDMAGKYESSIVILNEAKLHLNNTILYTCLGNNYKELGESAQAEKAYLLAFNMVPARFYPLYLLAKLYDETGQKEKAVAMANEVLDKDVKIESTAIKEIQEEMRKIIEKQDNTQEMFNQKERAGSTTSMLQPLPARHLLLKRK